MSRKTYSSAILSDNYASVPSLSRYCIRHQLHAKPPSLRKTALENGKSDGTGGAACDEGSDCFDEVGLGSSGTTYSPHFIYDKNMALLHVTVSRSDVFLPGGQRTSIDGVRHPVTTEVEIEKAAWERFKAMDPAMDLLNLQFFSHFRALLDRRSLYTLDNDHTFKQNVARQLQAAAPGLTFVFTLLIDEFIQSLKIKAPGGKPPNVIELSSERNSIGRPATETKVRLCL